MSRVKGPRSRPAGPSRPPDTLPVTRDLPFKRGEWDSPAGREAIQGFASKRGYPHRLHDFQVENVARILDGIDTFAVSATGSGKSALIAVPALLYREHITIVTEPTILLEEDMAANLQALGIETVVINGDSLSKASQEKRDLWDEALRLRYQIIIISPELLRSNDSYRLTDNEVFSEHWMYTVFDEAHLADEWAEDFRPDFGNLGLLRPRGGPHVTYVGLTATLEPGRQTNIVLERLGFTKGDYFLDRRDCERTNIDLIIRPLQFPFGGYHLRDLDWLIPENMSSILDIEKCIVFSSSLDFTYRISESLRSLLPDTFQKQRNTIIRQIHSLKCVDCKTETLAALRVPADSPERQMGLTSSTSVLDHGFNAPDIRRMISTGDMPSTAIISQRIGRILRDPRLGRGQGIFYVKPKELAAAQAWADENMTHPCMLHDVVHPEAHRTAVAERTAKATKTKQAQNSSAAIEDEHVSENEMDHDFEDEAAAEDAFWGAGGDNMEVADKDEEAPDAMDVDGNEDGIGGDEMEVDDAALSDAEKEDRFADTLRDLVLQREEEDDSMEEAYRPHRGEKQQADLASKYLFLSAPYRGVCLVRQLNLIYDNPNKTRNCGHCSVCKPDTPPAPRDINREPCKCTVCSSASTSTDDTEDAPKRPSKHNVPKYLAPAIADRLREGLNRTYRGLDLPMKRWFSADAAFPARMLLDLAEDLHLIFTRRDVELRIGRDSPADCTHVQRAWLHWEELGDVLWAELQVVWDVTKTVLEGAHQEKLKKGREKRAERKNEKGNTPADDDLDNVHLSPGRRANRRATKRPAELVEPAPSKRRESGRLKARRDENENETDADAQEVAASSSTSPAITEPQSPRKKRPRPTPVRRPKDVPKM